MSSSSVLTAIREMILQGRLAPGDRVPEVDLAKSLGVSRTPIRQALPALAEEGLITSRGARGYVVRSFSVDDIVEALDIRSMLEGMCARSIAEQGAPRSVLRGLKDLLDEGDQIFAKRYLVEADEDAYGSMNFRLHNLIVDASGLQTVKDFIGRVNKMPFTSPRTIAFDRMNLKEMYDALHFAHRQHHHIVQAVEAGESMRAEMLMREHAAIQKDSMNLRHMAIAPGSSGG